MSHTILIADDDAAIRTVLGRALGRAGYRVRDTASADTLWQWVNDGEGDLVITDVVMPEANGLDLIPRIRAARPDMRVIAMSARSTLTTAVTAAARGAFDYLPKPFDLEVLAEVVRRALADPEAGAAAPAAPSPEPAGADPLIGRSAAMQGIYRILARVMATDMPVLITGESGTGKELVARALHDLGRRKAGAFVAVNMAAIPRDLVESALFGHRRGAFTGAVRSTVGRFGQADGGTLFLDEIGDMPLEAQTRLLRVLQEGEYTAVGGEAPVRANARIVAATHRDLRRSVARGHFREDLFYRLNVVPVRVPPLRERTGDIPELVSHFSARVARESGLAARIYDAGAFERLQAHSWPGNVRELENLVRRVAVLHTGDRVDAATIDRELDMPAEQPPSGGLADVIGDRLKTYFSAHGPDMPATGLYNRVLREVERPLIAMTLEATNGNRIRAATLLGINRNTLRKKIRELDIHVSRKAR